MDMQFFGLLMYAISLATMFGIYGVLCLGLNLQWGFAGLFNAGIAGFFASACSLPFDYVKTQMQKMKPDAQGKLPYTGAIDCALKTFKEGGPLKFYTGFPTFFVRIGEFGLYKVPLGP